jgi:hypothetical protein
MDVKETETKVPSNILVLLSKRRKINDYSTHIRTFTTTNNSLYLVIKIYNLILISISINNIGFVSFVLKFFQSQFSILQSKSLYFI